MALCGKLRVLPAVKHNWAVHYAGLLKDIMGVAGKHSENRQQIRVPGCFTQTVYRPIQLCLHACAIGASVSPFQGFL